MSQQYIVESYIFNKTAKTIKLPTVPNLRIEGVQLITNLTTGTIIYQFNKSGFGGTVSGQTLTLDYNTAAMADTDKLQILYNPPGDGWHSRALQLLYQLLELVRAPSFLAKLPAGDMIRVIADANTNLNIINHVTNLTNLNGIDARQALWESWNINYNVGIRGKIT
jgi:hypothetical protein